MAEVSRRKAPPKGLQEAGKALWRDVLGEFEPNSVELALLFELCQTVDELASMKRDLSEMGAIVSGSQGQPKVNPLYGQIAAHRKLADQLIVGLGLPLPGEAAGRRRSAAAKQSADARWRQTKRAGRLTSVRPIQEKGTK